MERVDLLKEYKIFFNSLKGHCDLLNMSESHGLQNLRISWAELPTVDIEPSFVPHSGSVLLGELEQATCVLSASVSPHDK